MAAQYGEVARKHGLGGFTDEDIMTAFRNAFKAENTSHPNYGKATDMRAHTWWSNVIKSTFEPITKPRRKRVPEAMIGELITRFSTKDGYRTYPDVLPFFQHLREVRRSTAKDSSSWHWDRVIVGVITNSDDRIPGILESLGLTVGPRRVGTNTIYQPPPEEEDIAFVVMSYDVGFAKPDRRIFEAAEKLFHDCMSSPSPSTQDDDASDFIKVYVGDELEKDALAALDAGWNGIFLDREGKYEQRFKNGWVNTIQVPDGTDRTVEAVGSLEALKFWKPS
jgi:FMN phosphatase YigB (HAD superfamily)